MKLTNGLTAVLLFASNMGFSQALSGESILEKMHARYYQAPCRSYSFSQKNKHYRNDTVIKESVWHEAIEFPDKFRINFGDTSKGNFVIFRNDSAINYRSKKFLKAKPDSNILLLLLGGMYYRSYSEALQRLKAAGFKTELLSEQSYKGNKVYVIGALQNDTISNQIWVDKKNLRVLRIIISQGNTETIDMRFEAHQDWCKGYMETKVSFRRNGKLEQEEEYYGIKKTDVFPR